MRRMIAAVTVVCATFALSGCAGLPSGVEGDLTIGWPAMPKAKLSVPAAGTGYPGQFAYPENTVRIWSSGAEPVDCSTTHYTETAFVGTFTSADAQRSTVPDPNSPATPPGYDKWRRGVADYPGGDPTSAHVWLQIEVPTNAARRGGAGWLRCDLVHLSDPFATAWVDHGSLYGDLAGPRTSAYGCLTTTEAGGDRTMVNARPTECPSPHQAEFAGVFTAPNVPWPADQTDRLKMVDNGCTSVVATFLGCVSASQWRNAAVGYWTLGWAKDRWNLGHRTTECFASAFVKSAFVGSVEGIQNQTPKG